MKQKFVVYNAQNNVVDILTVTKTTRTFAMLKSTQEKTIEIFMPIKSLDRLYFIDTQIHTPAIITLN